MAKAKKENTAELPEKTQPTICLTMIVKNESQVKLILTHLKETRNIKTVPEIKRFSNN
jgi:hypothetical protein